MTKRNTIPSPLPVIEDNGKIYDIYSNSIYNSKYDYEYLSNIDDEGTVDRQYWSMEHEPPVNGEESYS